MKALNVEKGKIEITTQAFPVVPITPRLMRLIPSVTARAI